MPLKDALKRWFKVEDMSNFHVRVPHVFLEMMMKINFASKARHTWMGTTAEAQ